MKVSRFLACLALPALALGVAGCPSSDSAKGRKSLTIYCGRSKSLVDPILQEFESASGIKVRIKYAKTATLGALLLDEGDNSPADIFFSQDAGALGSLSAKGLLAPLSKTCLAKVDARFQSKNEDWVGVSGRARVLAYSTLRVRKMDLPTSIWDLTNPKWKGRIGWPPKNASFKAFITALRVLEGEANAEKWLEKMMDNEPKVYPKNSPIITAINAGEIDLGLVNHYYLYRSLRTIGDRFPVRNHHFPGKDTGSMVNIAGAAVLKTSKNPEEARRFIDFLLSKNAQKFFASKTYEYPLVEGIPTDSRLQPLKDIDQPDIDLNDLSSLEKSEKLLRKMKILK